MMNKISKYAWAVCLTAAAATTLWSCDDAKDSDEFTVGSSQGLPEVYFAQQTAPENNEVGNSDTEGSFVVYRSSTSAPSVAALSWSGDTEVFTLPTEAVFEDDAVVALITYEFDTETMEQMKPYSLVCTVAGTEATAYTNNSYALTVTYLPYSEWAPFGYDEALGRDGQGYYVFNGWYVGTENPVRVMYRYSLTNEDEQQYEFQWLDDYDDPDSWSTFLVATSEDGGEHIDIPVQAFDYDDGYGVIYVSTHDLISGYENNSNFNPETGVFTLDALYFLADGRAITPNEEVCVLNGYADLNDYSVTVKDNGSVVVGDEVYEVVNISWVDAPIVVYTAVETSTLQAEGEEAVSQELVEDLATKIINGEAPGDLAEQQGNYTFAFDLSGNFTVVAASVNQTVDGEFELKETAYVSFDYTASASKMTWSYVGDGVYTYLPFWNAAFGLDPEYLELYKCDQIDGYYKIDYWLGGVDFLFTVYDDNSILIDDDQFTGVTNAGQNIIVTDLYWFNMGFEGYVDGNTFVFANFYGVNQGGGSYGYFTAGGYSSYGYETFELDVDGTSSVKSRASKPGKLEISVPYSVEYTKTVSRDNKIKANRAKAPLKYTVVAPAKGRTVNTLGITSHL